MTRLSLSPPASRAPVALRAVVVVVVVAVLGGLVVGGSRLLSDRFGVAATIGLEARGQAEFHLRLQKQMQMATMHVHHFHIEGQRKDAAEFDHERRAVEALFVSSAMGQGPRELAHLAEARRHWDEAARVAGRILSLPDPRVVPLNVMHRDVQRVDMAVMSAVDAVERLRARNQELVTARLQEVARGTDALIRLVMGAFGLALLATLAAVFVILRSHAALRVLSTLDALTGLLNRREFHARLQRQIATAARQDDAVSLLLVDLDHFKAVNDRHGHQVGDDVLRIVASRILAAVRTQDAVARYGGEELALILPGADGREARRVADRVRSAVSDADLVTSNGTRVRLTVSVGIATFPLDARDEDGLIRVADVALYEAKENGRDQIRQPGPCVTGVRP